MKAKNPYLSRVLVAAALFAVASCAPAQTVLGSVPIGGQPVGQIEVNPMTDRVYVGGGFAQNALTVINASNPAAPAVVTTLPRCGVAVNPVTNRFYTCDGFGGTLYAYDGATNLVAGSAGIGFCGGALAVDPVANLAFIMSQCGGGNDPMHVMNGATSTILAGPLGSGGVAGSVTANPTTGRSYANRSGGCRVFGPGPAFGVVTNLGVAVFAVDPVLNRICCAASPNVQILDGGTHAVVATVPGVSGNSSGYAVDSSNHVLYVPDAAAGLVRRIDLLTNTALPSFSVGAGTMPTAIAVDSVKSRVYVASTVGGVVTVYVVGLCAAGSGQANSAAARLQVNGAGGGVCTGPFNVSIATGGTLSLSWNGPASVPIALVAGPQNPGGSVFPCIGSVDIGTPPLYGDIQFVFDGTLPGLPHSLFQLGAGGSAVQTFSVPLPPGPLGNFQGVVLQPVGSPCSLVLTAAFYVSIL